MCRNLFLLANLNRGARKASAIPIAAVVLFGWLFTGFGAMPQAFVKLNLTVTQTNFSSTAYLPPKSATNQMPRQKTATWTATCTFGHDRWFIETHFVPNAIESYYCDGTDVFKTTRIWMTAELSEEITKLMEKQGIRMAPPKVQSGDDGPLRLLVSSGTHPLGEFGANLPWLAYCSGNYLQVKDRLLPLPGAAVRYFSGSYGFKHTAKFFSDDLGLPKSIEITASTELLQVSPLNTTLLRQNPELLRMRANGSPSVAVRDGMLAGLYKVVESTNLGGWSIPTLFTYEQFDPSAKGSPAVSLFAVGKASGLMIVDNLQNLVSTGKVYSVVDYRFRSQKKLVDCISYPVTDGVIPPVADKHLQSIFQAEEAKAIPDPIFKIRYGIYGLITLFILGPAVAVFAAWKRQSTMKKQAN